MAGRRKEDAGKLDSAVGDGKLTIGERRLRGVDGREDGRSEGSRTVDELLERIGGGSRDEEVRNWGR